MQRCSAMKKYVMETSPLGPSRKVKAAIRKAVKDINTPAGEGRARLERLFLSKYGAGTESLLFANSLKELIFVICRSLRPKKILIIGPALNIYREAARAAGAVIESISGKEESSFFPNLQELIVKAGGCDLVFIANPNRITGKALSVAALTEGFAALSLKDCVTVIDESLIGFVGEEGFIRRAANSRSFIPPCGGDGVNRGLAGATANSRLDGAANSSNIIVLRTTAYYYGLPGLELACAVADPEVIESLRLDLHSDPSIPAMEAARTALKDKSYGRLTEQFMKEEKRLLRKAISRMPGMVFYDSDTNIFLLKAPGMAADIADRAGRAGLAVELCSDIDGLNSQFLRISVMKHDHNLKLIRLMLEISDEKAGKASNS